LLVLIISIFLFIVWETVALILFTATSVIIITLFTFKL